MLFRPAGLFLALRLAGFIQPTAPLPPAQVDACKLIDAEAVNAAAKAWFGVPVTLAKDSAQGPRGGTCDFSTDTPKHIDISVFYAPVGNPSMYGLDPVPAANETSVSGVGNRAVFDEDANPANRYKSENLAVLKGSAVLVLNLTLDQKLAFVSKEKLADFAVKQLVPKM